MPNGKPGDHPITDICIHGWDYFSPEVDELIRRISRLGGSAQIERLVLEYDRLSSSEPDLEGMKRKLEKVLEKLEREKGRRF